MKILIGVGIIWILLVGVIAYAMLTAPSGYQDDDGYHSED